MPLNSADFDKQSDLVRFANGSAARGWLIMPDPKDLTDEQSITLNDGANPAVEFRIDAAGNGVGGGATAINTSAVADGNKAALATAVAGAINGVGAGLAITATAVVDKVTLLNDAVGAAGNQQILQGGTAAIRFVVSENGMTGGATAITTTNIHTIREVSGRWYLFWI